MVSELSSQYILVLEEDRRAVVHEKRIEGLAVFVFCLQKHCSNDKAAQVVIPSCSYLFRWKISFHSDLKGGFRARLNQNHGRILEEALLYHQHGQQT